MFELVSKYSPSGEKSDDNCEELLTRKLVMCCE